MVRIIFSLKVTINPKIEIKADVDVKQMIIRRDFSEEQKYKTLLLTFIRELYSEHYHTTNFKLIQLY